MRETHTESGMRNIVNRIEGYRTFMATVDAIRADKFKGT